MLRLIQIHFILTLFLNVFAKQLPRDVIPEEYKLKIITNLGDEGESFNYTGTVLIHMKCVSPTDHITFHSRHLKIRLRNVGLRNLNRTQTIHIITRASQDIENDLLTISLSQPLQADLHYELKLYFKGILDENKFGYYRSPYLDKDEETKWLAVTYFKPNHARWAFPCFDEVIFKAKFTISLGRSIRFKSLSNMPLVKTEKMKNKPGWEWDHFETTPPMAIHTLGFAVIAFKNQTNGDNREIDLSIWRRDQLIDNPFFQHDEDAFARSLRTCETQLDMKYPLSKLDMIVIPDYAAPVMESWGLIVWREDYFMEISNPMMSFNSNFLGLVTEQMVHQIFGNLVTIKRWTELWFVEALNRYLGAYVENPTMRGYEARSEITEDMMYVFNLDSLENAHAISSKQSDTNAHKKGFLLIHMLSHIVGQQNLLEAIRQYSKNYAYKNVGSEELFDLTSAKSLPRNIDVKTVMATWTSQAGVPLITVTRNYKRGTLEVKQERFLLDDKLFDQDSTEWWIPLTYTTESELEFNNTLPKTWLSPDTDYVTVDGPISSQDWVIFNVDASGLYMVNYDDENWYRIINFLNSSSFDSIPPLNRVLLIESAARLAWIGQLDYKIFFDLIKYVAKDVDIQPGYTVISRIYDLNALLKRIPVHGRFVEYVKTLYRYGTRLHLDAQEEMPNFRMSGKVCKHDMEDCLEEIIHPQRASAMSNTITSMAYLTEISCTGAGKKQYPWSEYVDSAENPDIKFDILLSLTCCKNHTLLQTYLKGSLSEKSLSNEEIPRIITAIAKNGAAFDLVPGFLSANIKTIYNRISPDVHKLIPIIIEVARRIVAENELRWFNYFFYTNAVYFREIQSGRDEALEIAKLNVQWHGKNYAKVEKYFQS